MTLLMSATVRRPLYCLAHFPTLIQRRPESAFDTWGLDELQGSAAFHVAGFWVLPQELVVLPYHCAVAARGLLGHQVVVGCLDLATLLPCAYLPGIQEKPLPEKRTWKQTHDMSLVDVHGPATVRRSYGTYFHGQLHMLTTCNLTHILGPCLGNLLLHRRLAPAHAEHGGMVAVAVGSLLLWAYMDVQRAQDSAQLHAQLLQWPWNVFRLRGPLTGTALLAGFGCHLRWGDTSCVYGLQRPWL